MPVSISAGSWMLNSMSAAATPIDATQRRLMIGVVLVTLAILALTVFDLATGGRPDPPALRAQAVLLNGPWRFHTGDDPRWAAPQSDDSAWESIDMTAPPGAHDGDVGLPDHVKGWGAHGHPHYQGYAWYRRAVDVPAGQGAWDVLGPTSVEDGYELYWNGLLLGGSGKLSAPQRMVATRPLRFELPTDAAGTRGVLAIRAYMLTRASGGADGGGLHSAPILAPRPVGQALHGVQWARTIAGYIADAVEPLAMFALVGLIVWLWPRSGRKGFLACAAVALACMAIRRASNATVAWSDIEDLKTYSFLALVGAPPASAAWLAAWNRWSGPPWRWIDAAAAVLLVAGVAASLTHAEAVTKVCRWAAIVLSLVLGFRVARDGPFRILALTTLAVILLGLFGGELLDPLKVPGIWFPFGIGVSRTQYIYAVLIPLVGCLFVRTRRAE